MAFDFENEVGGSDGHIRIKATCAVCAKSKEVRKSWAQKKETAGEDYICRKCASKKNLKRANIMRKPSDFVSVCLWIYSRLYDDKSPDWISKKMGRPDLLDEIASAREFVYDFCWHKTSENVLTCADYIYEDEQGNQGIIQTFSEKEQKLAYALLELENAEVPDGLIFGK